MSRAKNNLIPLLNELENKHKRALTIVETGTIRDVRDQYESGDGHSTLYIAQWLSNRKYRHLFYSIDLYTETSMKYLKSKGLLNEVNLIQSDSLRFLKGYTQNVDFFYLDSANDPSLIFEEYKVAKSKLNKGGIIVVDDVVDNEHEKQKGKILLPYLRANNIKFYLKGFHLIIYDSL